jgi:hypothetical protein
MIDAKTLLNPDFADAELRAFAYLSAQYQKGVRSPTDCLQPFAIQAIAAYDGEQLDWRKVRTFLINRFSINVPFYMLERMQSSLMSAGAIEKSQISGAWICRDARPTLSNESVDLSVNDIDQLGEAINLYAQNRGVKKPLTADSWSDLIIPFFARRKPPKDKASAAVRGVLLSDPKSFDNTIIADFVMSEFVNRTQNYKVVEQIYHGLLVSDFLTQMEKSGSKSSFKGLSIVYDAPVIMRLLKLSGKMFYEATVDLHETLRELGCRIYYFAHTYDEVKASIDAIKMGLERSQSIFRETQEAISNKEISIAEIYNISTNLDLKLSSDLGLVEHAANYENRRADEYQIGEQEFHQFLNKSGWGRFGPQAANRDVMSLALITRLRGNKQVRDVSKAGYIFVTHNVRLALLARDYLREEGLLAEGSVWPFMTVGQVSTIAWVVNEKFDDRRHVSKELIANCYAATLPDEDFDKTLKEILISTNPEMTHELYKNAFVVQSVRQVALSQTAGHSALIRTLSIPEILAGAEDARNEAVESARMDARTAALAEFDKLGSDRTMQKRKLLADRVARLILGAGCLAAIVAAVIDFGVFGKQEDESQIIGVVLSAVAIYAALDVFGVMPAASFRAWLRGRLEALIGSMQKALT